MQNDNLFDSNIVCASLAHVKTMQIYVKVSACLKIPRSIQSRVSLTLTFSQFFVSTLAPLPLFSSTVLVVLGFSIAQAPFSSFSWQKSKKKSSKKVFSTCIDLR
jgi:hypothetical protein